jgi:glutamate-ammonia-ligase adenylyltransferase
MRLRPDGDQGPLARSLGGTLEYYVNSGRTWERQALIKCRAVAGDLVLGEQFLGAIGPFVYRRYLGATEIAEIKMMKRRIEGRTISAGEADLEVKTGHGGIRDVEFVVQFLQLLHGGLLPGVRESNTLIALSKLEEVGCLTAEERGIMDDTYRFLRQVEHRLQTMFDRQTHKMPTDLEGARTLAIRMGYPPLNRWEDRVGPSERFLSDYRSKTELNRRILNHLLHDAFRDDEGAAADPVVDLVLDPEPPPELIASALARFPFRDPTLAYQNLMALAREEYLFLSQARCRHFLAAIAPRLLQAVAEASDPDMALNNLEKVSASLGAKAMLWELFNYNPPTLRLFVEVCATSQLLSEILIGNPGMIDDLMDSLVIDRPQSSKAIRAELAELCRGAQDLAPILVGFRNKEWIRIGTRDVLGREPIRDVTRELSDVAEAIVGQVARDQWDRRAEKHGEPRRIDGVRDRWAIVALGKFGGRELNYRSDLDLVFLNESDGRTQRRSVVPIDNDLFLTEVVRRLIKALADPASPGPLYVVDTRLRPHGNSGPLVLTLAAFQEYYATNAKPWERLALTKARVVYSSGDFGKKVTESIQEILTEPVNTQVLSAEALAMRQRLQDSRSQGDMKRGAGGLVDVEFVVQYLQLVHARERPEVLKPNSWDALDALKRAGILGKVDHASLRDAYDFLRAVESRLRIVRNRSSTGWPEHDEEVGRLARRLPQIEGDARESAEAFRALKLAHATRTRAVFDRIFEQFTDSGSLTNRSETRPASNG